MTDAVALPKPGDAADDDWREQAARTLEIPFTAASVGAARHELQELLADAPVGRIGRENAVMVTYELGMNAVDHGAAPSGTFEIGWRVEGDSLVISVVDGGTGGEVAVQPISLDDPRGRGLLMVDAFSSRWEVQRDDRTRVTAWVDLLAD